MSSPHKSDQLVQHLAAELTNSATESPLDISYRGKTRGPSPSNLNDSAISAFNNEEIEHAFINFKKCQKILAVNRHTLKP